MVKIKEGTPLEDWFAVHVVDFFNRIQMLYLLIYDACTEQSCPKMSGGARVEYLWQDGIKYKVTNSILFFDLFKGQYFLKET